MTEATSSSGKRSKRDVASLGNTDDDDAKVALRRKQELQLALFECPVCFHYALPPIYQCKVGHVLCSNCSPQLKDCPSCHEPLDGSRSWAMEKVAETVDFPCKNEDQGCVAIVPFLVKQQHEENCEYRPCPCPLLWNHCQWSGPLGQLMTHLNNCLKRDVTFSTINGRFTIRVKNSNRPTGSKYCFRFQNYLGERFMFHFIRKERNGEFFSFAFVKLLGVQRKAENFNYKLKISRGRNSLSWESTLRSIYESYETTIQLSKCLTLDVAAVNDFADDQGLLSIDVTISKNTEAQC